MTVTHVIDLLRPELNPHGEFAVDGTATFELRSKGPLIEHNDANDGQLPVFPRAPTRPRSLAPLVTRACAAAP